MLQNKRTIYLVQSQGHLKRANRVHVCGNDGDPAVAALRVPERESPHQVHLTITIRVKHAV